MRTWFVGWVGSGWVGSGVVRSGRVGLGQVGSGWVGLGRVGLGWVGSGPNTFPKLASMYLVFDTMTVMHSYAV